MAHRADIFVSASAQKLMRYGLVMAVVVWLAWMLAETVWLFVAGPAQPVELGREMVILKSASAVAVPTGPSAEQVNRWELFGPLEQQAVTQQEVAPETRLRLELLGVFQNQDAAVASAIIAEQGKDGDLFHPGDKVPGNATLQEVHADHVILLRMGQREALRMKELALGGAVEQVSSGTTARTSRSYPTAPAVEDPSQSVDDMGDLAQQRSMIISRMGLAPSDSGGYLIGANAPDQLLNVVGLRAGDVLVSVNGYELGNEEADMAALQDFRSAGSASIVVQRGEQRFTVNYPP